MSTEIDILNTSWETFQRVLNHEQIFTRHSAPENFMGIQRLPSFQEIFDFKTPSPIKKKL